MHPICLKDNPKEKVDSHNTSHKFWDQTPCLHYQCCLQVSETVSWHKLWCCYPANILQHWVGRRGWFISAKWTILEFPEFFPGIDLVSIIYVRYYRSVDIIFMDLLGSKDHILAKHLFFHSVCSLKIYYMYTSKT